MFPKCSLQMGLGMRTNWQQEINRRFTMYLYFDTARQERMKSARLAETKEAVKDAVGAFAILAMLYIGLFIPNL